MSSACDALLWALVVSVLMLRSRQPEAEVARDVT
jgi:hypothetical protein